MLQLHSVLLFIICRREVNLRKSRECLHYPEDLLVIAADWTVNNQ